jgi:hypothetical protein
MELKHHKIESVKDIIFQYLSIPADYQLNNRKQPAPLLKKMISYFSSRHFSATQMELASFLNMKNHSSVSLGISSLIGNAEVSLKLRNQLKDIDRIIIEKGLSKLSGKNNEWFMFLDLNNFIIATKGEASVLWHKTSIPEIEKLLGDGWEFTEYKSTGKFFYNRKKSSNKQK